MAIPTFRDLVAMLGKTLTIEAQQTIMALQEEHLNLREQNNQLREENAKLKQLAEVKKKLQYEAPYYMLLDGGSKDGTGLAGMGGAAKPAACISESVNPALRN